MGIGIGVPISVASIKTTVGVSDPLLREGKRLRREQQDASWDRIRDIICDKSSS